MHGSKTNFCYIYVAYANPDRPDVPDRTESVEYIIKKRMPSAVLAGMWYRVAEQHLKRQNPSLHDIGS